MSESNRSFDTRINRFESAVTVIIPSVDYAPNNADIKKPALSALIPTIRSANQTVTLAEEALGLLQGNRLMKVFTQYKKPDEHGTRGVTNHDCFQERLLAIRDYIIAENLSKPALREIERIIKKIRPPKTKKEEGKKKPSVSEKTYAAAVGYCDTVVTLITNLGAAYSPTDANIKVAGMTALGTEMEQLNNDVQLADKAYREAVRTRQKLYNMLEATIVMVKSYAASLPGRKKNDLYIAIDNALKGR